MPKYESILAVYVLFLIFRLAFDILSNLINLYSLGNLINRNNLL